MDFVSRVNRRWAAENTAFGYLLEKTDTRGRYRVVTPAGFQVGEVWKSGAYWACAGTGSVWSRRYVAVWEAAGRRSAEDHPGVKVWPV